MEYLFVESKNYRTLMKETKEDLNKWRDYCAHRFRDLILLYCTDTLLKFIWKIQPTTLNKSNSMILWRNRQADIKVYVEKPKQLLQKNKIVRSYAVCVLSH